MKPTIDSHNLSNYSYLESLFDEQNSEAAQLTAFHLSLRKWLCCSTTHKLKFYSLILLYHPSLKMSPLCSLNTFPKSKFLTALIMRLWEKWEIWKEKRRKIKLFLFQRLEPSMALITQSSPKFCPIFKVALIDSSFIAIQAPPPQSNQ